MPVSINSNLVLLMLSTSKTEVSFLWIDLLCFVFRGPFLSIGSPKTFSIREQTSFPTGVLITEPVAETSAFR